MANYQLRNPEVTYEQAEETVGTFLSVPAGLNLTYAIDNTDWDKTIFDHSKFLGEADVAGGFDVFVNKLTDEIEAGGEHPIRTMTYGLELGDAAAFIGKGVANGILGWAGGQAIGWVLHSLGYRTSTEHMLEAMSKQLDHIQKSLDNIESLQVHTLNKINALAGALTEVYKGLKWESEIRALQARSSTIVTAITDPISKIKTTFDHLQRYSKLNPAKVDADLGRLLNKTVDEILSPLNGIEPYLETLHTNIVGSFGEKGLLEV